jgi:hypothetical protein
MLDVRFVGLDLGKTLFHMLHVSGQVLILHAMFTVCSGYFTLRF